MDKNDRQRQAEEMANKYCDENFATQHHDEYWENKSSYLKGWTDADSTPPQQEGDEEAAEKYTEERSVADYYNASIDNRVYAAFLAGATHARRAQNAEVKKRAELIQDARDNSPMDASQEAAHYNWLDNQNEKLTAEISQLRALLERANGICNDFRVIWTRWVNKKNNFTQYMNALKQGTDEFTHDYEKLMGKKG